MLNTRPKTLRQHLTEFMGSAKADVQKKAPMTVAKIAKQTSLRSQVTYLTAALNCVEEKEEEKEHEGLKAELEAAFIAFGEAEARVANYKQNAARRNLQERDYDLARSIMLAAKGRLTRVRNKIYAALEKPIIEEQKANWLRAVQSLCTAYVRTPERNRQAPSTNILDRPVKFLREKPESKTELARHGLSRDMNDYLFVKEKGEGVTRPGKLGGEYICCYGFIGENGIPEINVQRALIKQDTKDNKIRFGNTIAEYVTSEIFTEVIGDSAASVFYIRSPWNTRGQPYSEEQLENTDPTGQSVYDVSVFIDGFNDLYKELYIRDAMEDEQKFHAMVRSWFEHDVEQKLLLLSRKNPAISTSLLTLKEIYSNKDIIPLSERVEEIYSAATQLFRSVHSIPSNSRHYSVAQGLSRGAFSTENLKTFQAAFVHITRETPDQRPRFVDTPVDEYDFTRVFKNNIVDQTKEDKPCNYADYDPTTVASLLVGDFADAHTANYGVRPGTRFITRDAGNGRIIIEDDPNSIDPKTGEPKKELLRIDFGHGLENLTDEVDPHSHLQHLPVFGPTNHLREFPRKLRINPHFADELEKQGNFPCEPDNSPPGSGPGPGGGRGLFAAIDRAMDNTDKHYGVKPIMEFAKHLGLDIEKVKRDNDFDPKENDPQSDFYFKPMLIKAIREFLKEKMVARQVSLHLLALEIRLSLAAKRPPGRFTRLLELEPNRDLDKLIRQNPNYFRHGNFHFRDHRQRAFKWPVIGHNTKKVGYGWATSNYAQPILDEGIHPVIRKDLQVNDEMLRAKAFIARLEILECFEENTQEAENLHRLAAQLRKTIQKYIDREKDYSVAKTVKERALDAVWDDPITLKHLIHFCDRGCNAIVASYKRLTQGQELAAQKAQIDRLMDAGYPREQGEEQYVAALEANVAASKEQMHNRNYQKMLEINKENDRKAGIVPVVEELKSTNAVKTFEMSQELVTGLRETVKAGQALSNSMSRMLKALAEIKKSIEEKKPAPVPTPPVAPTASASTSTASASKKPGLFAPSSTSSASSITIEPVEPTAAPIAPLAPSMSPRRRNDDNKS